MGKGFYCGDITPRPAAAAAHCFLTLCVLTNPVQRKNVFLSDFVFDLAVPELDLNFAFT